MADRHVSQSGKADDGAITSLCEPGAFWSPRRSADAIRDIDSNLHTYYVDRAGYRTDVHVVDAPNGKYLRTSADRTDRNNLENLPDC